MWREDFSDESLENDFDSQLDVEMYDEMTAETTEDDDEISSDEDSEMNLDADRQHTYATRLREVQQNTNSNDDTIVELDSSTSEENSEISTATTTSSTTTRNTAITDNTFSESDIVGQPRLLVTNQQNLDQTIVQPTNHEPGENNHTINETTANQNELIGTPDVKKEQEPSNSVLNDSSETVDTCIICCEPFTSTSEHRVVALKCGHIFGKECIEKWLKTKESKRRCPKCNQVCNKNDIRIIYAKTIVSIDTSELDEARKKLDEEHKLRLLFEQQVEELKFDLGIKESENIQLKKEISIKEELIKRFKSSNCNQVEINLNQAKQNSLNKPPFTLLQQIDLKVEGCRLIAISEVLGYIVISQPTSTNSLIKGYGIRRISINNLNSSDFIFLHEAQIKDMALHPVDALLLTASFDKKVKLVNLITKQLISTFNLEAKPWCVTWNKDVSTLFYVGLNNGYLLECSQTTNSILKKINTCLSVPIKLIRYLNHNQNTNRVNLLVTSIKNTFFCEITSNNHSTVNLAEEASVVSMKPLPISGPIISTNIIGDNNSGYILLTVRPSNKYQNNVQNYLLDYTISSNNEIKYNVLRTFLAGFQSKHLISSKLFAHPDQIDSLIICSGDEDIHGAYVWQESSEKPIQKFYLKSVVFDVGFYRQQQSSEPILALLTERYLYLYKYTN